MKKILVGVVMLFTLGITTFARMHDTTPIPPHLHKMMREDERVLPPHMRNIERNPELERARILIEEKKLEIRKELLNDNPDWNKIEKINIEIATQEAKDKTCRMRERREAELLYNNSNVQQQ